MAKATKKQALGRGLSALLKETAEVNSAEDKNADKLVGNIIEISIDSIEVNPYQPRTYFDEEALRELASSIRELGVIQPITVWFSFADISVVIICGALSFKFSKTISRKIVL